VPAITPEEVVALQRLKKVVDWCQENRATVFFTANPMASPATITFGRVQVRVGIKIVGRNILEDAVEDLQRWLREDGRTQLMLVLSKEV
jgi:hypothetical protein